MLSETLIESILASLGREAGRKTNSNVSVLVEVDGDEFRCLYLINRRDTYAVVKSWGKVDLFKSPQLLQQYKEELFQQVEKKLEQKETVAGFATVVELCLN